MHPLGKILIDYLDIITPRLGGVRADWQPKALLYVATRTCRVHPLLLACM